MGTLTAFQGIDRDPAKIAYPPTLPLEIALRYHQPKTICEAYGIDAGEWEVLRNDPVFVADVRRRMEELKKDGVTFKVKARLQAEMLLEKSFAMVQEPHEHVPPAVKADLIKFTVRAAGLDGSKDQAGSIAGGSGLQINFILK